LQTYKNNIENSRDAFLSWVSAVADMGDVIPMPKFRTLAVDVAESSGKFVQRLPKSVHAKLAARGKQEQFSASLIAEGLGRLDALR